MTIYKIIKKILDRPLKTCLLPIRQTESYYCFLESKFFEQGNPFRMLLLRTGPEMKEASRFCKSLGSSEKIRENSIQTKTMIHKKSLLKKFILLQIVVIFIFITYTTCIEASRRKIDLEQQFEKSDIMHWTTIINDKMYDVYVDRNAEIIIIQGEVNTLDEKEKVEEYFKSKSPSNYKLICELNINNEINK